MGAIRRFWGRTVGKVVIIAAVLLVVLSGAALAAAKVTESNKFCGQDCHEMLPYNRTWEASKHSGVNCVTCHIPPGAWNFVKTKFFALREVYVHFTGQVKAPIQVTRHIPDSVCVSCHPSSETNQPVQLVTATFSHLGHRNVPACIDCHSQVVHHPIPGHAYIPSRSMTACFACHNGHDQPNGCDYCHQAPHPDRGACQDCHGLQSWSPKDFKHPQPLVGKHAQVLCEACHTSGSGSSIGPADGCVNCHGNHHGDPKMTLCADCHTITQFVPSTFVHQQVGPHVPNGEEPLPCAACHQKVFAEATCSCHGLTTPITPGQPIPGGVGGG
jgi:nitrate/TMAO reductase-like tetraheme cytochrome c subunit